jgi:hypothetical protein
LIINSNGVKTVTALACFADPATGVPRFVSGTTKTVWENVRMNIKTGTLCVWDAAGVALGELHTGAQSLAAFVDPAAGAPRVASCEGNETTVRIWDPAFARLDPNKPPGIDASEAGDPRAEVTALRGHTKRVRALATFADPATGAPRLASARLAAPKSGFESAPFRGESMLFRRRGLDARGFRTGRRTRRFLSGTP